MLSQDSEKLHPPLGKQVPRTSECRKHSHRVQGDTGFFDAILHCASFTTVSVFGTRVSEVAVEEELGVSLHSLEKGSVQLEVQL